MPTINKNLKKKSYKRLKETNKRDNENHKYVYNTTRWKQLRLTYLMENPLCKNCLEKNLLIPAVQVHHIIPISSAQGRLNKENLGFNYNNLKGLCKECHKKEHL
jgi:5-methylcytosine-specific restriction protein A